MPEGIIANPSPPNAHQARCVACDAPQARPTPGTTPEIGPEPAFPSALLGIARTRARARARLALHLPVPHGRVLCWTFVPTGTYNTETGPNERRT